jgi:RNA polymerase-associated protein CTR9
MRKQYEKAFVMYEKAYSLDSSSPEIQFLMGQMNIFKNHEAIDNFKVVLKHDPNNYESLKILSSLYQQKHEQGLANQCIEKMKTLMRVYHEQDVGKGEDDDYLRDPDVLINMARIVEETDPQLALKCALHDLHSI